MEATPQPPGCGLFPQGVTDWISGIFGAQASSIGCLDGSPPVEVAQTSVALNEEVRRAGNSSANALAEEPSDPFLPAAASEASPADAGRMANTQPVLTGEPAAGEVADAAPAAPPAMATPAERPNLPTTPPPWRIDPVTIKILPSRDMNAGPYEDTPVLVRVESPALAERVPSCLCCVLDVSGSMGSEATIAPTAGSTERQGLSLLDVAKHGVRTVINAMNDQDQLAIVTFNQAAITVMSLTVMDAAGRKLAEENLSALRAGGGTNLWAGLFDGLEAVRKNTIGGTLSHIMLLSDGESNHREQILPNLLQYKAQYERLPGTINTFGFGYNIDSGLLVKLANIGDGSYAFLPDAGFIGTAFVNCVSNLLVTFAREVRLSIEPEEGCEILEVLGGYEVDEQSWGVSVKMGMLQYQQPRDVILRMKTTKGGPFLLVSGNHEPVDRTGPLLVEFKAAEGEPAENKKEVMPQLVRCKLIEAMGSAMDENAFHRSKSRKSSNSAIENPPTPNSGTTRKSGLFGRLPSFKRTSTSDGSSGPMTPTNSLSSNAFSTGSSVASREAAMSLAKGNIDRLIAEVKPDLSDEEPKIKGMYEDMTGQVSEAVSCQEYYTKWGRHYLPSIMFAHKLQQCNNFKDPGVQSYGGVLFNDLRDIADDIFCQLPPPEPTAGVFARNFGAGAGAGAVRGAPVNMAAYNDRFAA